MKATLIAVLITMAVFAIGILIQELARLEHRRWQRRMDQLRNRVWLRETANHIWRAGPPKLEQPRQLKEWEHNVRRWL